jgi:hypothetical protein
MPTKSTTEPSKPRPQSKSPGDSLSASLFAASAQPGKFTSPDTATLTRSPWERTPWSITHSKSRRPCVTCPEGIARSELNLRAYQAMTHPLTSDQTNAAALPHQAALREIIIYGHTTLFFWWPAWAIGFVFAVLNAGQEKFLATAPGSQPSSVLGLSYVAVILLLIVSQMSGCAASIRSWRYSLSHSSRSCSPGSAGGTRLPN